MKLTEKEKQIILDLRKKEQEKVGRRAKSATLKHDLYFLGAGICISGDMDFVSLQEVDKMYAEAKKDLMKEQKIPKGTLFYFYCESGDEWWEMASGKGFDDVEFDFSWAVDNLENVKTIKGKRQ